MIFLYWWIPELWGRMKRAWAGNEKTRTSEVGEELENPLLNPKT